MKDSYVYSHKWVTIRPQVGHKYITSVPQVSKVTNDSQMGIVTQSGEHWLVNPSCGSIMANTLFD